LTILKIRWNGFCGGNVTKLGCKKCVSNCRTRAALLIQIYCAVLAAVWYPEVYRAKTISSAVYNHVKFSTHIKNLVDEVLEIEDRFSWFPVDCDEVSF